MFYSMVITYKASDKGTILKINGFVVPPEEMHMVMSKYPNAIDNLKAEEWFKQRKIQLAVDYLTLGPGTIYSRPAHEHILPRRRTKISRIVSQRCSCNQDDFGKRTTPFHGSPTLEQWRYFYRAVSTHPYPSSLYSVVDGIDRELPLVVRIIR